MEEGKINSLMNVCKYLCLLWVRSSSYFYYYYSLVLGLIVRSKNRLRPPTPQFSHHMIQVFITSESKSGLSFLMIFSIDGLEEN